MSIRNTDPVTVPLICKHRHIIRKIEIIYIKSRYKYLHYANIYKQSVNKNEK